MIVVTPGEPAGIGPDLVIQAAQQAADSAWAVVADVDMLRNRAQQLGLPVQVYDDPEHNHRGGRSQRYSYTTGKPVVRAN